jgi:hypothetical protein
MRRLLYSVLTACLLVGFVAPSFRPIGYTPRSAEYFELIQDATLRMSDAQLEVLDRHGFVMGGPQYLSFSEAYDSVFQQDLPVYITADSILFSLHRSFDAILKRIELTTLIPELGQMLEEMRTALAAGALDALGAEARNDADLYLAVALGLLNAHVAEPVAGADAEAIGGLWRAAMASEGAETVTLFGVSRQLDYSQFEPRGHYTDTIELERYFRSMIWLGRIDARLIEASALGELIFHRRQANLAAGLAALSAGSSARYDTIRSIIDVFVGQPDGMTPTEFPSLYADLSVGDLSGFAALADATISDAVARGGYGEQRIASHIMSSAGGTELPLNASFLVFGQAYILDSHLFSELVFDRLISEEPRLMPNPLDIAYTALDNPVAWDLLAADRALYGYGEALDRLHDAVNTHDSDFWEGNLYNLWLRALRGLSPDTDTPGLPSVFRSEAWARRMLNTQMASWAELRHDTLLYAKQSYTMGIVCEFPDVYVDPYPAFWRAVAAYANAGHTQVTSIGITDLDDYFTTLGTIATTLGDMAERQLAGLRVTDEHLKFANEMVRIQAPFVCGGSPVVTGWYGDLFVAGADPTEFDPTIADVHTQPTDAYGSRVGRVLHVGTGRPRLMWVSVDTPDGPRAFVGVASSYYETITEDYQRLNDADWAYTWLDRTPDVSWVGDIVAD